MNASLPSLQIQAFAERPLQGNGAAVVLLDRPADPDWMQAVAAMFQQSETAFLLPWTDQQPERLARPGWALRWFTPSCEVPLCGHATLAATLALEHWGGLLPGEATSLLTRSGPLAVSVGAAGTGTAELVLPCSALEPCSLPQQLGPLLGGEPLDTWQTSLGYWVALLPASADLIGLDGLGLAQSLGPELSRGLVLMQPTSSSGEGPIVLGEPADYQLRFFAPGLGISEDPVTGSAHALVAPWWCERLGRPRVVGWQASKQGGGMLCEPLSSGMIHLTGAGQLVWDGVLMTGCVEGTPGEWRRCLDGG
ncbi:PhzF family phenazine biosynthesis protein [Synechococcus sp. CS-1325]|uniref:PhzF family phenazine biosynthesis protein n=1 Tax=unclassified Synechococcus TaxID=2626047 RepID=UPI000DB5B09E|nr:MULTISPECIES: PhzF family phenazine biosynthesis protein [unclassified Synechococcus]MCT0199360.1 PhzF family phenazine biosynthesis protein [Synechococcus sp. CS-1325]MCT0231817.1 PhzF family phenazine biosynthesis protein [Synechococcus sp. CS-1324]PZV02979.1 MAG: PhzF family phenazine biosynthesis protein [Cyanobium sp.]PZV05813.1 MAG: PhzF family phenazine biosynthesis protein [Cyanobium sp.]